jgi:hypothetical protein
MAALLVLMALCCDRRARRGCGETIDAGPAADIRRFAACDDVSLRPLASTKMKKTLRRPDIMGAKVPGAGPFDT